MTRDLRSVLHDLAPEPPADLAGLEGTRRRARSLRRHRHVSVAAAVALVAGIGLGVPLATRGPDRDTGFVAPATSGTYPDWPRRGEVTDPDVDRSAISAWDRRLRTKGVHREREPRVLYAGGSDPLVVVLHGPTAVGGERLVVLTRAPGGTFTVHSDRPAPDRGQGLNHIAIRLDAPPSVLHCHPADTGPLGRLLVLAEPGTTKVEWAVDRTSCPDRRLDWQPVDFSDGVGHALLRLPPSVPVLTRGFRADWRSGVVTGWGFSDVYATRSGERDTTTGYGRERADGSRAHAMLADADRVLGDAPYTTPLAASLPDGTRVVLAFVDPRDDDGGRALLVADDAAGRTRLYLDVKRDPIPSAYAVVVDGYHARWLVVIGSDTLREAVLVDGGTRTPVPLTLGWGALRLDREPSDAALVWTPDHAPDGGVAIQSRSGRLIDGGE